MSKKRKISILLGLGLVLAFCTVAAVVFYYAESSEALKSLVERSVSRSTGTQCTISEFAYSLDPLSIRARGIQFIDHVRHFHLDVPELVMELSFQGPFTRRSLVVKRLTIQGFSLNTDHPSSFTERPEKLSTPGFFSRLVRGLVALLLFKDIRVDHAELTGGHVNSALGEQNLTLDGIHLSMGEAMSLQVSCHGRLRWPSKKMELTVPHLRLTADRAFSIVDPQIRMTVKSEEMTFAAPHGKTEGLSGETELIYDRDKRLLTFHSARLCSESLIVKQWNGTPSPPLTAEFKADGFLDFSGGKAGVQHFQLVLKELLEATGAFHGEAGANPKARITGLVLQMSLAKVWPLLSEAFGVKASSYLLGGEAHVTGDLHGVLGGKIWEWDCDLHTRVKDSDVSFTTPDAQGRGVVTADLQVKGIFPAVQTDLTFAVEQAGLSWKGVELKSVRAAFSASGKGLDFDLRELRFRASEAEFLLGGKRVKADVIEAESETGKIGFAPARLVFPRIDVHSSLITNLQLSLEAHDGQATLGLEGKKVGILSLARALNLVSPDWQLGADDSLSMKGTLKKNGYWLLDSKWNLDQFAFQSPDSMRAGEKISIRLRIEATGDMHQAKWAASMQGSAGEGGLLIDRVYLDLDRNSLRLQAKGDYNLSTGTADISEFNLALKDLLSIEAKGRLTDPTLEKPYHLHLRLPQIHISPAFQLFFKEPLKREVPFLEELNVGGDFEAEMEVQKEADGWRLLGHCSWRDGEILGKGYAVEGIELDLPFWGEHSGASVEANSKVRFLSSDDFRRQGKLLIRSMTLPYLPKQSFAAQTHTAPNLISLSLQNSIKTTAGEIELGPISLHSLFTLSPSLVTSVTLKQGDLAPILSEFWAHPVSGSARGKLDVLTFDGHRIQSRGSLSLRAFGGEIVLSNLGGAGIFGATPTFLLDAAWKDINLAQLTEGTPFEKVEGILKGQVKHLEMVGGEPQRFDLFMETVQTGEVPQKISVRALENIARIGGGGSPFMGLAGALTTLFKEFPYEKIAIQASLENDVFRIDGPLKEGDKVYLVKRSGFSGVNVVNQDPDRQISFKDMMKRIKRVTESAGGLPPEEQNPKNNN